MKKRFADNNTVLWHYLEVAASSIEGAVHHGNLINFRCNICGDGETGRKKRGNLIFDKKRDIVYYKCFNYGDCAAAGEKTGMGQGGAWGGARWLKTYFPHIHKQYRSHIFQDANQSMENLSNKVAIFKNREAKKTSEQDAVKHFVPILKGKGEIFDRAISICNERRIFRATWSHFFVATDGIYKNRLIIPFYDATGSIYYYQARDLVGQTPKYLNRKVGRDTAIYNLHHIDRSKPVIVLEGPLDSIYVENAVATLGIVVRKEALDLLEGCDLKWLYDNDIAGLTATKEKLKLGKSVFMWSKFIEDHPEVKDAKDINEAYIMLNVTEKFTFGDLNKYFTNHYLDLVYL
jgi:hypothetical protein